MICSPQKLTVCHEQLSAYVREGRPITSGAPIFQRSRETDKIVAIHEYDPDLVADIARYNGGLTIEEADDALRRGKVIYTSFSYWRRTVINP